MFIVFAIIVVGTSGYMLIEGYTFLEGLYMTIITITTVGYGDKFPVTTEGRIIAALLMTVGVGLFGTFTAFLASWFVDQTKKEEVQAKIED